MFALTFLLETLQFLLLSVRIYFWEMIYLVFRNRPRKDICNSQILITGTGSGIGRLLVGSLAKSGNTLHCVDIDMKNNTETKNLFQSDSCQIYTYTCDIGSLDSILALKTAVQSNLPESGHIEYLFNNAGVVVGKLFQETSLQEMNMVMRVNALGVMHMTKVFLDDMIAKGGHLVYTCSVAGLFAAPLSTDYVASKHAITGFTRNLIMDLEYMGVDNVKITTVFPHHINTGMFSGVKGKLPWLFPMLEPEYVTEQMVLGVREEKSEVFLPWIVHLCVVQLYLTNATVFRAYCHLLGNDLMKDFRQTRKNLTS